MTNTLPYQDLYDHYNSMTAIPVEEWIKFTNEARLRKIKKKETLLHVGENADKYYVVLDGILRMFYIDNNGNEFIKAFRQKFDLASPYGELIQQKPSRITIDAIEDTEILEISYQKIMDFSKGHNCWEKLAVVMLRIHFLFKEQREYDLLILDAKQRYHSFIKDFPSLINRIPKFQIASYLGITPVSLSRLLAAIDKDSE